MRPGAQWAGTDLRSLPTSQAINRAMQKPQEEYSIGVLDIYGFEIFQVWALLPGAHPVTMAPRASNISPLKAALFSSLRRKMALSNSASTLSMRSYSRSLLNSP